jgi:sugar phosphate isomerase/epimerase
MFKKEPVPALREQGTIPMKIAVITDEIDNDLDHALRVMGEYGVHGAELRQIGAKNIADTTPDEWPAIRETLARHGAIVAGLATPFYKCDLPGITEDDPAGPLHSATARGLGDQIRLLEHCIAAAKFFDTRLLRVFSFWKRGPLTPQIEEQIVDAFAEPAALAEREGITLALENEHACYLGTGAQTARVLAEIDSPAVRAVWDPGNAFMDGEIPFPNGYAAIKPFVAHVHVKDAEVLAGEISPVWSCVGEGKIDWAGQIAALSQEGYSGFLSLETHYKGRGTKEASSRACLEGLLRLMPSH